MEYSLIELDTERDRAHRVVFELLDQLDAIEVLRAHTPASHRYLLDRLECRLRLLDRLDADIEDAMSELE